MYLIFQVKLKESCPLPKTAPQWNRYSDPTTRQWRVPYILRLDEYLQKNEAEENKCDFKFVDITTL
jgi:hypothetical protein